MKTAISLPDELFAEAEEVSEELQVSRSELYARALREFLEKRSNARLTKKINEVCAEVDTGIDSQTERAQFEVLSETW